jgi:long-chain acyl-CoA synthetase
LTHSEAKACFIGKLDGWEHMKPGVPADLPCLSYPLSPQDAVKAYPGWDAVCKDNPPLSGKPVREAQDLATLIYTSGTTGMPKGVMHSFSNFAWALDAGIGRLPMGIDDRMLSYLPLAHVVERVLVEHGWLRTGLQVYFAESLDTFAADLQRARPTIFFSVPRLWVKFQQGVHHKMPPAKLNRLLSIPILGGIVRRKVLKALGLDQCRIAAGGAAPMPMALLQWYSKLGLHINEGYGMTENLAVSHITEPGKNQQGSVGPAYDGVEHRIDSQTGEIQMRSPALMLGYFKEPEKTREAMTEDGWLRTGDKGRIDAQGILYITGRVKDLFKTGKGKYVAPAPIEDKLVMNPFVEACCVTGANLGQPLALLMLNPEAAKKVQSAAGKSEVEASMAEHLQHINDTLDPHEQLDCLVLMTEPWSVENDLITPTFKVKRNRVEDLFAKNYESWAGSRKKVIWYGK